MRTLIQKIETLMTAYDDLVDNGPSKASEMAMRRNIAVVVNHQIIVEDDGAMQINTKIIDGVDTTGDIHRCKAAAGAAHKWNQINLRALRADRGIQ